VHALEDVLPAVLAEQMMQPQQGQPEQSNA